MSHHAYVIAGEREEGITRAKAYIHTYLGSSESDHPDIALLQYGLFPVEEARKITDIAYRTPVQGERKGIIIAADRIFHEAQNALLKVFEEPPAGTVLILVVPTMGIIIPTLRSRLLTLDDPHTQNQIAPIATEFLKASKEGRAKIIEKILTRTKSDKEAEKDQGRAEARSLFEGVTRAVHNARKHNDAPELLHFLRDMNTFAPMLHERAAPLKLIFEHMMLVIPKGLDI